MVAIERLLPIAEDHNETSATTQRDGQERLAVHHADHWNRPASRNTPASTRGLFPGRESEKLLTAEPAATKVAGGSGRVRFSEVSRRGEGYGDPSLAPASRTVLANVYSVLDWVRGPAVVQGSEGIPANLRPPFRLGTTVTTATEDQSCPDIHCPSRHSTLAR